MEIQEMSLDLIKPYENNPRINDGGVDAVANSIKEFGWEQPIVVDKNNVIIVGHTRWLAAHKLNLKTAPVVVASHLTPDQVKAYRMADNKTNELTEWDDDLLNLELDDIEQSSDIDMSDFGFESIEDEIDVYEDKKEEGSLKKSFFVPPFSVINLASKEMLDKSREWKEKIKDDGSSRGNSSLYEAAKKALGSKMPLNSIMNPAVCELINRWFLPLGKECNTFDCFSGDTAFGFVSSSLGNHFTGIELRKQQVAFNQQRCDEFGLNAQYIQDDGQNVRKHIDDNSQDLLFSCPPYFDLEKYSDDPKDASNQDSYEDFIKILDNAFTSATHCLKNNRFACIVVGNIRDKKGFYYDFVGDIIRIFEKAGMHFYNDITLRTPVGTAAMIATNTMRNRKVVRIHQNLLVFYKGDNPADIGKEFGHIREYSRDMEDKLEEYIDEG